MSSENDALFVILCGIMSKEIAGEIHILSVHSYVYVKVEGDTSRHDLLWILLVTEFCKTILILTKHTTTSTGENLQKSGKTLTNDRKATSSITADIG